MSAPDVLAGMRAIWHRRWMVMAVAFSLVFTVIFAFAVALPTAYRAEAMLVVDGISGEDRLQTEVTLQTLSSENLSHSRLVKLIDDLGLYPELRGNVRHADLVVRMRRDIGLHSDTVPHGWGASTTNLSVSYVAPTPEIAAAIADRIARFYIDTDANNRRRLARRTLLSLQQRTEALKEQLAREESRVRAFTSQYRRELPQQVGVHLAALDRLSARLQKNREAQLPLLADIAHLEASGESMTADERVTLLRERQRLATLYTDQHPDVRAIDARLRENPELAVETSAEVLDQQMANLDLQLEETDQRLAELEDEEERLIAGIDQHSQLIRNAPLREQQLAALRPSYETTRERYRAVLQRYGDAKLLLAGEREGAVSAFRIVDHADPAAAEAAPHRTRLVFFGLFIAMLVAAALALILERVDRSFHSADELRSFTTVAVLGVLPRVATSQHRHHRRRMALLIGSATMVAIALMVIVVYTFAHDNHDMAWLLARRQ